MLDCLQHLLHLVRYTWTSYTTVQQLNQLDSIAPFKYMAKNQTKPNQTKTTSGLHLLHLVRYTWTSYTTVQQLNQLDSIAPFKYMAKNQTKPNQTKTTSGLLQSSCIHPWGNMTLNHIHSTCGSGATAHAGIIDRIKGVLFPLQY